MPKHLVDFATIPVDESVGITQPLKVACDHSLDELENVLRITGNIGMFGSDTAVYYAEIRSDEAQFLSSLLDVHMDGLMTEPPGEDMVYGLDFNDMLSLRWRFDRARAYALGLESPLRPQIDLPETTVSLPQNVWEKVEEVLTYHLSAHDDCPEIERAALAIKGDKADDGRWPSDPDFPIADWQSEVANGDTRLGYTQWVLHQKEARDAQ